MKLETARFERVRQRTQEVMQKAKSLFGVDVSSATIQFNLRGRAAGLAGCRYCAMTGRKNLSLRFNCEIINSDHFEDFLAEIIPHEVAHLCGFVDPRLGRKHDAAWRRTCIALGGNGARTHSYDVVVRGRWDYVTDLGHKVSVSKRHHLAVQAGLTLRFKRGLGMITKLSQHAPSGQLRVTPKAGGTTVVRTQPKQASAPAPKTIINTTPTASNWAQRARQLIQLHKPQGVSMEMVMAMAIEAGMPRERARTCVKGFWEKV